MPNTHLRSPWLEYVSARSVKSLESDHATDIVIVGAGIAGVTTAYFLLKNTNKQVSLIEANRVAHGATGHNAGQLVSYFERPFHEMVSEFGLAIAAEGQKAVESAWNLLEDIRSDLDLETPCLIFTGYAGCVDLPELMAHLRNNEQREKAGLSIERILVATPFARKNSIPRGLKKYFETASEKTISDLLQTKDHNYIAVIADKKGCMNSASFTEEVVNALLKRYPKRLFLVEHTPVSDVRLFKHHAELVAGGHAVRAKRVVLCTNGFERMRIENTAGADIDVKFHHLVRGSVGYMAAFTEEPAMPPTAISYLPAHAEEGTGAYDSDPYYYVTRRPYGDASKESLVSIGGPEALMDDTNDYSKEHPYPDEAKKMIEHFVQRTYRHAGRKLTFTHLWHGLMGYTPNGIRCVGAEPCNAVLLYNLGCNGVGILPSIYGSLRISQIINGERLGPSIFDPADRRCVFPEHGSDTVIASSSVQKKQPMIWVRVVMWLLVLLMMFTVFALVYLSR